MTGRSGPEHAAMAILVRGRADGGLEVLLTRRSCELNRSADMYLFPGGLIRKEDSCEPILRRCYGLSLQEAQRRLGGHLSPELSLAHWVTAIRELFEATGILLCFGLDGKEPDAKDEKRRRRIAENHQSLICQAIDFRALLESEGLFCATGSLCYFSHWRMPEKPPIRYDAYLFLALLPADQDPITKPQQANETLWVTPDRSLELCEKSALSVDFPTFASLRSLADFESLDALLAEYRGRGAIP